MAKSNAELQQAYRERAKTEGDGQRRIDTWVPSKTFFELERLAAHYRVSKREIIIRLLAQEDQRLIDGMDDSDLDAYINREITG